MARRRGERAVRPRLPGAGLGGAFFFFSQFPLAGSRKPGAAGRSGPRCSSSSSRSRPGAAAAAAAEAAAGGVEPPWPPLLRKKPAQLLCADPRAPVPAPRPPRLYPIASTPASASANFHAASAARPGSTPMVEAIVEFDYQAQHDDELTISVGNKEGDEERPSLQQSSRKARTRSVQWKCFAVF